MATVRIPDEHFTKSVRKEYSNPDVAIIREMLQNSIDAGAKNVNFTFNDMVLTCEDDGSGMTEDILVSAMLTLSGSHKGPNSVGGFGAAKALILFQHEWYKIETNDILVEGKVLQYDLIHDEANARKGTKITVKMANNGNSAFHIEYYAKEYLKTCDVEAKITFNGEIIKCTIARGPMVRELPWAKIHAKRLKTNTSWCFVAINGITMFSHHIGEIDQHITIDITKPSTEILTVNRDGLTNEYTQKLQELMAEIVIEKATFGKAFNTQVVYPGRTKAYTMADVIKRATDAVTNALATLSTDVRIRVKDVFNQLNTTKEDIEQRLAAQAKALAMKADHELEFGSPAQAMPFYRAAIKEVVDSFGVQIDRQDEVISSFITDLEADFTIYIKGRGFNKVPQYLQPENMGKRHRTMAKLWKRCVKIAMAANKINVPFSIGWVLDHEASTEALTSRNENNVQIFLFNPLLEWSKESTPKETFFKMLMIAGHEVTHLNPGCKYHNETFSAKYDSILHKTLMSVDSWWDEYLAVKDEIL